MPLGAPPHYDKGTPTLQLQEISDFTQLGNNATRARDLRLDKNSALWTGTGYSSRF